MKSEAKAFRFVRALLELLAEDDPEAIDGDLGDAVLALDDARLAEFSRALDAVVPLADLVRELLAARRRAPDATAPRVLH